MRGTLDRIREAESGPEGLNAFISLGDEAAGTEGHGDGPLAGVPVAVKDNIATLDLAHHVRLAHPGGISVALRGHGVRKLREAGAVVIGQDEPGRVRHGLVDRELGVRTRTQPARPEPRHRAAAPEARPRRWPRAT